MSWSWKRRWRLRQRPVSVLSWLLRWFSFWLLIFVANKKKKKKGKKTKVSEENTQGGDDILSVLDRRISALEASNIELKESNNELKQHNIELKNTVDRVSSSQTVNLPIIIYTHFPY